MLYDGAIILEDLFGKLKASGQESPMALLAPIMLSPRISQRKVSKSTPPRDRLNSRCAMADCSVGRAHGVPNFYTPLHTPDGRAAGTQQVLKEGDSIPGRRNLIYDQSITFLKETQPETLALTCINRPIPRARKIHRYWPIP